MQPFPPQDNIRESRVVEDICVMLHDDTDATRTKVKRWIQHVLNKARAVKRLWFLENLTWITLGRGRDVVDLLGHVDSIHSVFCPLRLDMASLSELVEQRQWASAMGHGNAGKPEIYAVESGRRIHLFPCPHESMLFSVLYSRPIHVALVPDHWETIILDGVLAFYGQHFDRDALTQNQELFEGRFYGTVRRETDGSHDASIMRRYARVIHGTSRLTADSESDSSAPLLAPASLTGIGYVSIDLGYYPWEIQ